MAHAKRVAVVVLCSLGLATAVTAQETTAPPTPAQVAAMERVRPLVDAIWLDVRTPSDSDESHVRYFWEVTDKLIAIGPDVVPFVASELELMDPSTFHFCAYALGRLGGRDAELALRKAVRAADARGGKYGTACKRFALYALAVLGVPDGLDLMQSGASMHLVQMIPDLSMPTLMALLVGPKAEPLLLRQLEAYASDPAATEKLEDTLLALGRVGDAALVPKVAPLLTNASPEIRALAADTMSRVGEPPLCDKLLPSLSGADRNVRRYVAKSFERWKPEPCYRAMVGRLEVEDDVGVRGPLYKAIAAMGGESSLDVFRGYLRTRDEFDQALAILAIGEIGSKKGLNMLRSLLTDERAPVVVRALQGIGAIGGEGAIDTLMATTSDSRRNIASSACEVLTDMGVKKVAPRVASEMLAVVREPVGNLALRTPIDRWGDALVKFGYTDPIDDLKAAASVQSDPVIKDSLTSCVRRLQLIAKNGDDVSAWAAASASPMPDARRLADRRLAELGTPAAVRAIAARLARTDIPNEEREGVLMAIAEARTAGAAHLVERHLSDPAYDAWDLQGVRSAAAWAARRLGGERMITALRLSAVRRDGRDWATLVYLAVLERSAALPTLKNLRVRRLRYPEAPFGREERLIDGIISDLAARREPKRFDVPPAGLSDI